MEKFSQFRDKGTAIAPFLPIPTEPAGIYLPFHIFLFVVRVPLLLTLTLGYFFVFQWLPIGNLGKRAALWSMMGVPGIWWIDLQVDGVKRGSISSHNRRLPQAGSVIASTCASPIDALYLAAIFDPVFTASYPTTRLVEPISLFQAMLRAFFSPKQTPSDSANLVDIETLIAQHPSRAIVVFPECTPSNGRGILPLSPSLLSTPRSAKVYPVNLRYTSADITTPIPHAYFRFLWNLCSQPTHCIRIRVAEAVPPVAHAMPTARVSSYNTNYLDTLDNGGSDADTLVGSEELEPITKEEKAFLDKIAESLARLGRIKRVGLGVKEKEDFVAAWTRTKSRR